MLDSGIAYIAMYKNNGNFVSVYRKASNMDKLVKGLSLSTLYKNLKKGSKRGLKGYYFIKVNKEFYNNTPTKKRDLKLEIGYLPRERKNFMVITENNKYIFSNNQKEISRLLDINQGGISYCLHVRKGGKIKGNYFSLLPI